MKLRLLISEAKRWVSFVEVGGDNKGQVVEMFQRVVGKAVGEAWCLSFVQYCLKQVDSSFEEIYKKKLPLHGVNITEHCLTCWHKTPAQYKFRGAKPGRIIIWRHGTTTRGHAGIVVHVERGTGYIWTVEGNTGPSNSTIQRDGDGVYLKRRKLKSSGTMQIVGFIQPWV